MAFSLLEHFRNTQILKITHPRACSVAAFQVPRDESTERIQGRKNEWIKLWDMGSQWNMIQALKRGNNAIARGR